MKKADKSIRVLELYRKLQNGKVIEKAYEANQYGVTEKTIERDLDEIRRMLSNETGESGITDSIEYDRNMKGYCLHKVYEDKLSKSEILAVCKILLDSRAFTKKKIDQILEKLISCCAVKEEQKVLHILLDNERYYYVELQNKKEILEMLWNIGQAIRDQRYILVEYQKLSNSGAILVKRKLRPVAIMFSEFYFYMAAFIEDEEIKQKCRDAGNEFPTIYRINRIQKLSVTDERFKSAYANCFQEGEFRKRVQFMYSGQLRRIKLQCREFSLEAVLDRFPTAEILSEKGGIYTIKAEVFGDGVDMWLRGQGKNVTTIEMDEGGKDDFWK